MLSYKGYHGRFEVDFEADIIHGEVVDVTDVITFQGRSPAELETAFRESIDDYLAYCAELGTEPDRPFNGQFIVRAAPELHRYLFVAASTAGKSLNQFVVDHLTSIATTSQRERAESRKGARPVNTKRSAR